MAFDKQFRTPAVLTGVARGAFQGVYGSSIVSRFLPAVANQKLSFSFTPNQTALTQAAKFRAYNTESDQTKFGGSQARQGTLPPISRRYNVDEYTHLKMIGGDLGAEFERKAEAIAAQIAMRFVQASAEAIETGKVSIDERDLKFEIDYGRKAALTATAAAVWSDPTADIIADLEALRFAYGSNPGSILIPFAVQQHLSKNAKIIEFALGRDTGLPSQIPYAQALSVLAQFGFEGLTVNDERLVDQSGQERNLFSQKKIVFLPGGSNAFATAMGSGPLGTLDLGVTSEAYESENGLGGSAGLISGAYKTEDPNGFDVLVGAIGLPVVTSADRTASLEVLA
ncbi:MAG: major capsid protein [Actinobacteria bacterium]|nr:major capsid protein [Actinomycetota bacterium]